MGRYINVGNEKFQSSLTGEYVDKSGLIGLINQTLLTENRFSCVTHCRRFGKSMAAKMLCAYYDQSCDSRSLFEDLLEATLRGDGESDATSLDSARNDYTLHREMPAGKGFADLIFKPHKNVDKPALLVELKKDQSADAAISQIKRKNYPAAVVDYLDNLLLVGINYDMETKQHSSSIEKYQFFIKLTLFNNLWE